MEKSKQLEGMDLVDAIVEEYGEVEFPLTGEDGNAMAIMGRFRIYAQQAGWPRKAVKEVQDVAMSGNYDRLLQIYINCGGQ